MGITGLISLIRLMSPIHDDRRAFVSHPLFKLDEGFNGGFGHGVFDLAGHGVFLDLLSELAPHSDGLIAITVEEGKAGAGADSERTVQMPRDDLSSQSCDLQRVKTAEGLRR